ncbi:ribonucleoside-diphosphate reductase large subunit [Biomphalaria glabrata]|nr:ribonucleoside-diphosphate reductase large subunit [Biomphalaria glabrata]
MFFHKRDVEKESMQLGLRIQKLCSGLSNCLDQVAVTKQVMNLVYPGITATELDNLSAEVAFKLTSKHPDYSILATRIAVSNLHRETNEHFSEAMTSLHQLVNPETGKQCSLISDELYEIILNNADKLNSSIDYERDYQFTYLGLKTLQKSFLLKVGDKVAERPQHMFMRVALSIHMEDINSALETYHLMSEKWFLHSPVTMVNGGTVNQQLLSCYLVSIPSDSIEGIFDALKNCALISKCFGDVGLGVHCVRASGSYLEGIQGKSNGIVPMLRVFNATSEFVEQGSSKRLGALTAYLEPWHPDIFEFLELKKNTGKEEMRAKNLAYALWVPDLFMRRVEADDDWTLMCPYECPGLDEVFGQEFETLYQMYERENKGKKTIRAQKLWFAIFESQTETGSPYMLYKDSCNRKSNQQNLGTIKCSNLCTEIVEFSSPDQIASCCTASLALNKFVQSDGTFHFEQLRYVTAVAVKNLDKLIDRNVYPVLEAEISNKKHRPIGLGVQGLADAFILMRYPFDSPEAKQLNKEIFETIYFAALDASCELAEKYGPYETYPGSPVSKGILQHDMWNVKPITHLDWASLRQRISKHGVRNSLLVAVAPSEVTSLILDINDSVSAYCSHVYKLSYSRNGFCVRRNLVEDLTDRGLWNEDIKNQIIAAGGSIQGIASIPEDLKDLYKTVWEMKQKVILELAADRGAFIDQSQSVAIHMRDANYGKLTSMHYCGWRLGLKTGLYSLKTAMNNKTSDFSETRDEMFSFTQTCMKC